jgi:hypothetical protein
MENTMTGTETAAGGWLLSTLAKGLGGLFGGLSMAMFHTPKRLRMLGKVLSVLVAGCISSVSALLFTGAVADWLGVPPANTDTYTAIAAAIGMAGVTVLNWLANTAARRENMDIGEVAEDIKRARQSYVDSGSSQTKPKRAPASRRKAAAAPPPSPRPAPARKRPAAKKVPK